MRLFAALIPPREIIDEVEAAFAPHHAAWPDLRWTRRELLHVTVAFYGELDEAGLARLLPRLERVADRHQPLRLSFAGAGVFPGTGVHARVLWTGLYGDRRPLARLAASASAAGRRAGSPMGEFKGFRPHLTLARSRTPQDLRPLVEKLTAFTGSSWTAGALNLIRSHLGPRPSYETLKTWPLGV